MEGEENMNTQKMREVAGVIQGLDPANFDMNTYGNRGPGPGRTRTAAASPTGRSGPSSRTCWRT